MIILLSIKASFAIIASSNFILANSFLSRLSPVGTENVAAFLIRFKSVSQSHHQILMNKYGVCNYLLNLMPRKQDVVKSTYLHAKNKNGDGFICYRHK